MAKVMAPIFTLWNYFQECAFGNVNTQKRLKFLILFPNFFVLISGSLESPLSASPIQSYHQSSTYFYQNCQWFFDPPPARELQMKISTTQTMGMFIQSISISWWLTPLLSSQNRFKYNFCNFCLLQRIVRPGMQA